MRIKKFIAIGLSLAIAFGGIEFATEKTEKVEAASSYELVWSDEFDGTSLSTSTWNYEIGNGSQGWGNWERQYYTNRKENVEVSNGTLKIKALKENYGNCEYTSGRITTKGKQDFKFGKIEARMKLPSFSGSWPAFWMLGSSGGWPRCGEIDIMEAINAENNTYGYLHWYVESEEYNGQGDTGGSSAGRLPAGYNRTDWHTYGVIWDEDSISWYIDDVVFNTADISADHMSEFRKNQYIILNLAIGGLWPGYDIDSTAFPSKSVMEVDYVRVYQLQEEPTTKYDGPMITVTEDAVQEFTGDWTTFFSNATGWTVTSGTVDAGEKPVDGFTANITSAGHITGDSVWGVQANLEGIKYYQGATYKYTCTITSDVDKVIFVKVADEDEETVGGGLVELKAGVPYEFETDVTIPADYEGKLSLKFGMGKTDGDTIADNSAVTINVRDISFVTTTEIPDPEYVAPTTTTEAPTTTVAEPTTDVAPTTTVEVPANTTADGSNVTTTQKSDEKITTTKVKAPKRTKVKSVKKKSSKVVKISLKKIKGAKGYKVKISTSKKFKKSKTVTRNVKKANFKIKSKKFKNKKKLYVKARAYKIVNGKKLFGKWSKRKSVKIKKKYR